MYLATFALQGDWLEAVRRIPKHLLSTRNAAAGAICHCAGYLMQALIAAGKREEEAALLAGERSTPSRI